MENVSSEEELLQLRNEGKITEDEYDQLHDAVRKSTLSGCQESIQEINKAKSKRKQGKIAFYLMLGGIVLPILGFIVCSSATRMGEMDVIFNGCLFACVLLEMAALGTGITSWADPFGKAATITSSLILVTALLSVIGFMPQKVTIREIEPQVISSKTTELEHFALDDMEGVITQSGVEIDKEISSDGNGSLRIEVTKPATIRLFETGDIDIENALLIYQARIRTENVQGQVYLEMWCHFAGVGDFFSRGLQNPLTGTTEWTMEETPFFLKAGENPDNVKLNIVINGSGTVGIDDIRLLKGRLKL